MNINIENMLQRFICISFLFKPPYYNFMILKLHRIKWHHCLIIQFAIIRDKQIFSNFSSIPLKCFELLVNIVFLTFLISNQMLAELCTFHSFPSLCQKSWKVISVSSFDLKLDGTPQFVKNIEMIDLLFFWKN